MPEIEREKVRAMLAEVPEGEQEALLVRLKERGYTIKGAGPAASPRDEAADDLFGKDPGQTLRRVREMTMEVPVPGLAVPKAAIQGAAAGLERAGEAISERLGARGVPPLAAAAAGAIPAVPGAIINAASTLIPGTVGEVAMNELGGAAGRGIASVGARALPAAGRVAPNATRAVKAALAANITPTVAQITQSRPLAAMEEVMSRIPFFGRRIVAMREAQEKAFQALRTRAVTEAGVKAPASEVGAATQQAVFSEVKAMEAAREKNLAQLHAKLLKKGGNPVALEQIGQQLDEIRIAKTEEARKTAGKLYQSVADDITPELDQVADNNLKGVAAKRIAEYENLPSASLDPRARKLLEDIKSGPGTIVVENAADPMTRLDPLTMGAMADGTDAAQVISKRKTYTFQEMQTLRSTLNDMIQQERLKVPPGQMTVEGRIYKDLKTSLDADIESFSNGLPADIKKKFEVATAYYRDHYKGVFANKTMKTLGQVAKEDPENVYKMLIQPGDVSDIRRLKAVVGEPGFVPLRRKVIEDLVTGADGRVLGGPEIVKNMAKFGDDTLREILTPEQFSEVQRFVKTRELPRFVEGELERKLRRLVFQSEGIARAPEAVVESIVNGDVATLRAVKKIVGAKGAEAYKRRIIEDILGEAADPTLLPGQAQNKSAMAIGKALKSYDENFLKEMFSDREIAEIQKIDDIRALLESQPRLAANAPNTAAAMIAPAATGGLGALMVINPIKGVTAVIGADILSRLYTSESGRKLLIQGMDPRFAKNTELFGRITTALAQAAKDKAHEDRVNRGVITK